MAPAPQRELVDRDYFQPGIQTAKAFGLKTEFGIVLAFDIHVQNDGVGQTAREAIRNTMAEHAIASERELRVIIANAVADKATDRRQLHFPTVLTHVKIELLVNSVASLDIELLNHHHLVSGCLLLLVTRLRNHLRSGLQASKKPTPSVC